MIIVFEKNPLNYDELREIVEYSDDLENRIYGSTVVERGSNSNGTYIKYGDGIVLMMCSAEYPNEVSGTHQKYVQYPITLTSYPIIVIPTIRGRNSTDAFRFDGAKVNHQFTDETQTRICFELRSNSTYNFWVEAIVVGFWK